MRKTVLALACVLLAPMFLVSITASAPYSPWVDLDADGDVDIFDVVTIAGSYGTTGDSTKPVYVTNFPLDEEGNLNVSMKCATKTIVVVRDFYVSWPATGESIYWIEPIDVDGFSEMYVHLSIASWQSNGEIRVYSYSVIDYIRHQMDLENGMNSNLLAFSSPYTGVNSTAAGRYYVSAPRAAFQITASTNCSNEAGWALLTVIVYLKA